MRRPSPRWPGPFLQQRFPRGQIPVGAGERVQNMLPALRFPPTDPLQGFQATNRTDPPALLLQFLSRGWPDHKEQEACSPEHARWGLLHVRGEHTQVVRFHDNDSSRGLLDLKWQAFEMLVGPAESFVFRGMPLK